MFKRFDYASYRELLARLRRGHRVLRFQDVAALAARGPYFILRHDIDHSPEAALALAEFEAALDVHATYFLLPSSDQYNLLAQEHCRLAAQLVALGHEVGLHYDLGAYETQAPGRLADVLHSQARLLEDLSGTPVRSIAMHNPSLSGPDPFRETGAFVNAYDAQFTREIAYFSDSCGARRTSAITALTADPLPPALQLLIHPIFWGPAHADRWQRLAALFAAKAGRLREQHEHIRAEWSQHPGLQEHDRREAQK